MALGLPATAFLLTGCGTATPAQDVGDVPARSRLADIEARLLAAHDRVLALLPEGQARDLLARR
jgi:hypothetical protein